MVSETPQPWAPPWSARSCRWSPSHTATSATKWESSASLGTPPVRVLFCYPDVYEVGMSHTGTQILYHLVNRRPDRLMERAYAPWPDMEREMRERDIPLFSLESRRPAREFDIIAFTLQSELTYTNILTMLDLAGLPIRQADRRPGDPLVLAGGPCASNPEPLAAFFDAFLIGDAEDALDEILGVVADGKGGNALHPTPYTPSPSALAPRHRGIRRLRPQPLRRAARRRHGAADRRATAVAGSCAHGSGAARRGPSRADARAPGRGRARAAADRGAAGLRARMPVLPGGVSLPPGAGA